MIIRGVWLIGLILLMLPVQAQTEDFACPGALPSRLVVNAQARVTADMGINFRDRPSTGGQRLDIILGDTVVEVIEGPYCAEGYAWWRIEHNGMLGWTAESLEMTYLIEPFLPVTIESPAFTLNVPARLATAARFVEDTQPPRYELDGYPIADALPVIELFDTTSGLVTGDNALQAEIDWTRDQINANDPDATTQALTTAGVIGGRVQFVDYRGGLALRLLRVQLDVDAEPITPVLVYEWRALITPPPTDEIAEPPTLYLRGQLPINAPGLPLTYTPPEPTEEPTADASAEPTPTLEITPTPDATPAPFALPPELADYQSLTLAALGNLDTTTIQPELEILDALVASLVTAQAQAQNSGDVRTFRYFDTLTFDYIDTLATNITTEVLPPASNGTPQHIRAVFDGYPIGNYRQTPAIRVYRAAEYTLSQDGIAQLAELLAERPVPPGARDIPGTIDIFGQARLFVARPRYVDFQNGAGVRFITLYASEQAYIANESIFYYFIGLTDDGQLLVTARFPVNASSLPDVFDPASPEFNESLFSTDYAGYLEQSVTELTSLGDSDFFPQLADLDAVIASMGVSVAR